jgi:hypothetical protein
MTPEDTPEIKFTNDAVKRARLLTLLDDPVMREAMDIVDDSMRPKAGGASDTNQPLSIALFHQSAGASTFQAKLQSLTKERIERKKVEPKALAKSIDDLPPNLQPQ